MHKIFTANMSSEFPTRERCSIVELMNDPEFSTFSVARCRVEAGVTTEFHSLISTAEVYVVLEGRGMMEDGKSEGRAIGAMDCVQISIGYPQRITNTGSSDLIFLAICAPRFEPESYLAHEEPEKVAVDYGDYKE